MHSTLKAIPVGIVLLGCLIVPPVVAYFATKDGAIEDSSLRQLLWIAAVSLWTVAALLAWLQGRHPWAQAVRGRLYTWRYRLAGASLVVILIGASGGIVYVNSINNVDLLKRLAPSHPSTIQALTDAHQSGRQAALAGLLERSRRNRPLVQILPYQIWDKDTEASDIRRQAFLSGDLGAASGTHPINWRADEPYPSSQIRTIDQAFRLHRHEFIFDLLGDPSLRPDREAFQSAVAFQAAWRQANRVWPNFDGLAWNDDTTANRAQAQLLLMDAYRLLGINVNDEEILLLKSIVQHADRLQSEEHYNARTNHGMMQNSALLSLAVAFPELDPDGRWKWTALKRTAKYVREGFSLEGVSLELTPAYHWFGAKQLTWFVATCHAARIEFDPHIEAITRKALSFCRHLLQPDQTLPMIADTHSHQVTIERWPLEQLPQWPELTELATATISNPGLPNNPGSWLWPESGYFILRAPAPSWNDDSAFMLTLKIHSQSRAHSHNDALSLTLYANGRPVLSGPGYPDYEATTNRFQIIGTPNQNTVSVDGKSQALGKVDIRFHERQPIDSNAGVAPVFSAIQASSELYPGVRHTRSLFYGPTSTTLLLVDELEANEPHDYRLQFRLGSRCIGSLQGNSVRLTSTEGERKLLRITTSLLNGQKMSVAHYALNDRLAKIIARGRSLSFITVMELDPHTISVPTIDTKTSCISWSGRRGLLTINLPIVSKQAYRWEPIP